MIRPFSEAARQLFLRFHTAKRMQPRQLTGIGKRKARALLVPRLPVDVDRWYERCVPDLSLDREPIAANTATLRESLDDATRGQYRHRAGEAAEGTPTFLGRTLRVADGDGIGWYDDRFDELPLLWALKLYAFQVLDWLCLGYDPGAERASELREAYDSWVRDWIESVGIGRASYLRRAWTPWAVSLRTIHLSRYLAWRSGDGAVGASDEFETELRRELGKNALFLEHNVEWDVGGNHLIENGAALVVAGTLFERDSWVETGTSVLTETARTQFLDDGCHFERSPMYHVLTVTRYLTACDLLERSGRHVPAELRTTARDGVSFLGYLRPPDGRIPLLNDSVYGQALPLDDCLQYADSLGFGGDRPPDVSPSGYRWLCTAAGRMLLDGGPVGPDHLPGHSHSDTLGLLLWLGDRAVVTDTGTYGYVSGDRREYARGVRGHSTVQVGDSEPIAVGGTYLMGPRPEPTTRFVPGTMFEGFYEVRPYRRKSYTHHRSAHAGADWWLVRDTVDGADGSAVRSRLHLHPETEPALESSGRVRIALGGGDGTVFVYPLGETEITVASGRYFPRFGTAVDRPVLTCHAGSATDPATIEYLITRAEVAEPAVKRRPTGQTGRLRLGTDTYPLEAVWLRE